MPARRILFAPDENSLHLTINDCGGSAVSAVHTRDIVASDLGIFVYVFHTGLTYIT